MAHAGKVIIHYDEIALKGGRRKQFEQQLVAALNGFLKADGVPMRARRDWGRIFIESIDDGNGGEAGEGGSAPFEEALRRRLRLVPGISNFGFARSVGKSADELMALAPELAARAAGGTFRVTARRTDKSFPLRSQELERRFGAAMLRAREEPGDLKVSLKHFDHEVRIEVLDSQIVAYVKERGIGGLAVCSSGRMVSLLSAGFDSPVASFMMMKRGARVLPLHFHSVPLTSDEPLAAVHDLCGQLSNIQGRVKLALAPVAGIQRHLEDEAPEPLRIVLLRRSFMRLACRYAARNGALALITGESLGQVASQTVENMRATDAAAELPVMRPLCGLNKTEIIDIARRIGTEAISARPCEDTCALFVPRAPETRARLDKVLTVEEKLSLAELENEALDGLEYAHFEWGREMED